MADNTQQQTGEFMKNRAEKIAPLELPSFNLGIVELLNSISSNFAAPSEETIAAQKAAMENFPKNTGETTKIPPVNSGLLDSVKSMFGSAAEVVTNVEQQLRNVIDSAPLLPNAPNPLIQSLMIDSAVAATRAADSVRDTSWLRADGSEKGQGFLGQLAQLAGKDKGKISTEISVGVNIDGKQREVPTLVPTLSQDEINYLQNGGDPRTNESIMNKAVAHARKRISSGLSVFEDGKGILPVSSTIKGEIGKSMTVSGASSEAGRHMLSSFEAAFPARKFSLKEKDGMITVEDIGAKSETAGIVSSVPVGYNPETASKGLNDLQTQLTQETDLKKQLELAYRLKSAVAVQSAAKYGQYTAQADAENQVPELVQALALSRQLDAQSATVRASGMMSRQTYELLGAIAAARNGSAKRTKELMQMDPVLGQADTIANLTVSKLEKGALLDQRTALNDQRTRQEEERTAAVNDLKSNPTLLPRVALLKTGQPLAKGSEDALANQIVAGKIHLDDTDKMIIQTPTENMAKLYQDSQDQKLKTKLLPVMLYEEAKNLQGKTGGIPEGKVALERAKQFRAAMELPMTSTEMAPYRKQYERDMLEVNTTLTGANKTKGATEAATRAHMKFIDDFVIKKEQSDIRSWQGLIKSDVTATAVMKQYADAKPGTPIQMKEFITGYLNYNDGKGKADKVTALRALVSSHVDAIPESVFFPKPAASSFLSAVDKLTAASFLENTGFGSSPFGWS